MEDKMDIIADLTEKLRRYSKIDVKKTVSDTVPCNGVTPMKLRDHLMEIGTILEHDEKSGTFVVTIGSGFGKKNLAIVGLMFKNETLYAVAYAEEGLIKQNTAKKAIQRIWALFQ